MNNNDDNVLNIAPHELHGGHIGMTLTAEVANRPLTITAELRQVYHTSGETIIHTYGSGDLDEWTLDRNIAVKLSGESDYDRDSRHDR